MVFLFTFFDVKDKLASEGGQYPEERADCQVMAPSLAAPAGVYKKLSFDQTCSGCRS